MMGGVLQTIGIGEMRVSADPADLLITYSLGSCVGLTLYDPVARIGGLVHCLLPSSRADPADAAVHPTKYTDTGAAVLMQTLLDRGARKERLIAKAAGGGAMNNTTDMFRIGERNCTVLRKLLWRNDVLLSGEDTGGDLPRTLALQIQTGRTIVRVRGVERDL